MAATFQLTHRLLCALNTRYNLADYDDEEDLAGTGAALGAGAGNGLAGLVYHASNDEDPYLAKGPEGEDDDDDEIEDFRVRPEDNLLVVGQTEDVYSHLSVNGEFHSPYGFCF